MKINMTINIAICDDDIKVTSLVENYLCEITRNTDINISIDVFYDGSTLVDHCKNQKMRYDIIYLDIEMKTMGGIEAAKNIRLYDREVILIFVSNYDNYLKELLEIEPFRFLDKPIVKEDFENYFYKAINRIKNNDEAFTFKYQKEHYKIRYRDIIYFESCKRVIIIITQDTMYQFYGKLNDIEKLIYEKKHNFLRIHQSYLVNLKYIKKISFSYIELENGELLKISDERQKKVRDTYCRIIGGKLSEYNL